MSVTLTPEAFHPVFELQLLFLEDDFINLFGFGEVMSGTELAESVVEVVMPGGELLQLFGLVIIHVRLLELPEN